VSRRVLLISLLILISYLAFVSCGEILNKPKLKFVSSGDKPSPERQKVLAEKKAKRDAEQAANNAEEKTEQKTEEKQDEKKKDKKKTSGTIPKTEDGNDTPKPENPNQKSDKSNKSSPTKATPQTENASKSKQESEKLKTDNEDKKPKSEVKSTKTPKTATTEKSTEEKPKSDNKAKKPKSETKSTETPKTASTEKAEPKSGEKKGKAKTETEEAKPTKNVTGSQPTITAKTYLKVKLDGNETGLIVIGVYGKRTPKAAENFRALCSGEKGMAKHMTKTQFPTPLHYKGNRFGTIGEGWMIQGGQIGRYAEGIYGNDFSPEFGVKKTKPGLVGMAKRGKKNMGSTFFILTKEAPWTEGKHTYFGEVLEGFDVVLKISEIGVSSMGARVIDIIDAGECTGVKGDKNFVC